MVAEHFPSSRARARLSACTEFALANPRATALFLDVDGTLLELAATPKSVRVPQELVGLLERLAAGLDGAVAIISGRLISEIDRLLDPLKLTASGVHGAELRQQPDRETERMSPALPGAIATSLSGIARKFPGVIVEPKGPGLAVHYRLAPTAEEPILAALERLVDSHGDAFTVTPGKKIFEIVPAGFSKGTALTAIAALPAFRGRVPIMIGDDIGDEPAFAAATRLHGFALRVAGENYGTREADFEGPGAVLSWLAALAEGFSETAHPDRSGPQRGSRPRPSSARP